MKFSPGTESLISLSTVRIQLYRDYLDGSRHASQASGTGFLWRTKNQWLLATALHNLTGLRSDNGKPLGSFIPNALGFWLPRIAKDGGDGNYSIIADQFSVQIRDSIEKPLWLQQQEGLQIDFAAIAIPDPGPAYSDTIVPLNELVAGFISPRLGSDCFVIGYPEKVAPATTWSAVWKRASVATDPRINAANLDIFYADTATRPGMSGSPVLTRLRNPRLLANGRTTSYYLSGIYAGRTDDDLSNFQVGRVFGQDALRALLPAEFSNIKSQILTSD